MKKSLLAFALLAASTAVHAQIADVSAPRPLLKGVQSEMYNPVLSADGSKLMFSNAGYTDLRVYDFTDNVTARVKDITSAGDGFRAHFVGNKIDIAPAAVRTEGSTLIITAAGKEKVLTPAGECAGYVWPSLSPDGKKVMFVAAGKGIYITDLKGNVIARPGNYEAPAWYGNDHIVVQNSTDDGHQLRSSQILLLNLDGSQVQQLTKPESMTLTPTASAKSGKIVYGTIDGRLYEVDVTLKK